MIVLIPAYEPDDRLVRLVESIRRAAPQLHVVVVDDGSGSAYTEVFAAARARGAAVIGYAANRGKGSALKSGFRHAARAFPGEAVVCADCDGQHDVADILRVAGRVEPSGRTMVLGSRRFTGRVPPRSRLGNAATAVAFRLVTRVRLHDTQTGLRAYPAAMLPWLATVDGDRFEYELNLLLHAAGAGYAVEEVEIATIYLAGNASSHFRPVLDSLRIYAPLAKFALSSVAAFVVDTVAVLALVAAMGSDSLLPAVLGARALSASVNFLINRALVFDRDAQAPVRVAAARYWALVAALLAANFALLTALTELGLALLPAKVLTEAALWAVSYQVQRRVVFAGAGPARTAARGRPESAQGGEQALVLRVGSVDLVGDVHGHVGEDLGVHQP
ncbi:glycosyltransferase [Pengzhenrongella sicca]|uniref:Glycosyltransferase n=1 Tax=Pengzhenrongella sicca TaxID=2819238 RepID=A0A8A4Z987_9MICO|nr:glycosyltransferase [Pengzhenrongella sicca]QTE27991.1 glycosyltransferase [Pengzhenrongella sicca]